MEQKDKDLLLQDLCTRLPYGVKIYLDDFPNATLVGVVNEGIILHCDKHDYTYDKPWDIGYVKPYLFPLSSMTEEQKTELCKLVGCDNVPCSALEWIVGGCLDTYDFDIDFRDMSLTIDWLNKNHFDYHYLVPKGLAKDATGLNIY